MLKRRHVVTLILLIVALFGDYLIRTHAAEPRRPVIPVEVIKIYGLRPSEIGFIVKGEDGQDYSLDDTMRLVFAFTRPIWSDPKFQTQFQQQQRFQVK